MNIEQFQKLLLQKQQEIEQAMRRTLPVKVGRIAKDHFQSGFRQGGFQDNGTQAWQRKKRPDKYGPLMSSRQNLYGSIYYQPGDASVTVGTSAPYAEIHNEGGDIKVTAKMKRFFWAKYRETNGGSWKRNAKNEEAEFWNTLALKKVGAKIHIPQRKFIGESQELNQKIKQKIDDEIDKILRK